MFIPVWALVLGYLAISVYTYQIFELDREDWRIWNLLWGLAWPLHLVVFLGSRVFFWLLGD